ncbi:MAG: hypothetical protein WDM86_03440 [Rhizomicrobium sp.]
MSNRVASKTIMAANLFLGLLAVGSISSQAGAEQRSYPFIAGASSAQTQPSTTSRPKPANFLGEPASSEARQVADWVLGTSDNRGSPFVIVDKKSAKVFVFDDEGRLLGATPALLGSALGDDSAPGIGDRKLSDIPQEERTTPAGRFEATLGRDLSKQDVLWVDYDAALALHRLLAANVKERRRMQRIATASPLDKRITFGCIEVPAKFYESVVHPTFAGTRGIVYILPEIRSILEVFFTAANPSAAENRRLTADSPAAMGATSL